MRDVRCVTRAWGRGSLNLHGCTRRASGSTTRTERMQCLFVEDRLIGARGSMIMYNEFCHVCSRPTQIAVTSGFQEEIRFCGIFPLDRGIAGVDAISRDIPGFTGMVGRYVYDSLVHTLRMYRITKPWYIKRKTSGFEIWPLHAGTAVVK